MVERGLAGGSARLAAAREPFRRRVRSSPFQTLMVVPPTRPGRKCAAFVATAPLSVLYSKWIELGRYRDKSTGYRT